MKLMAWNCRGLGAPSAVQALNGLVRRLRPDVVFLSETKKSRSEMEWIKVRMGFDFCLAVDCVGRSGGLALLWCKEIDITIKSYSSRHIDAVFKEDNVTSWRATRIYGNPETCRRKETWNLLRQLNEQMTLLWLCVGDFNKILSHDEKLGGATRPEGQITAFKEVVDECSFHELPVHGPLLTWSRWNGDELVMERLDRGLGNDAWINLFRAASEEHIVDFTSDHLPLLFNVSDIEIQKVKRAKLFRFENLWSQDASCIEIIRKAWENSYEAAANNIAQKIRNCAKDLADWNNTLFSNVKLAMGKLYKEIKREMNRSMSTKSTLGLLELQSKLSELQKKEATIWRQRSKQL